MNYQCKTCGSPTSSRKVCEYCGNALDEGDLLLESQGNKTKLDLAIYELRQGRTLEAKRIFDSILLEDPNNKLAYFYKYVVEIDLDGSLNKVSQDLIKLNFKNINSTIGSDLFKVLLNRLSFNDTAISNSFIEFILMLRHDIQVQFMKTMVKRYSSKSISFNNVILKELEVLLKSKELMLLDKDVTIKLINNIKKSHSDALLFKENMIKSSAERIIRKSKHSNEPVEENEYLNEYIKKFRYVDIIKNASYLNIIPELEFEKYIEEIEKKDKELKNLKIDRQDKTPTATANCFIATATMGDYNHPIVVDLRNFRDEWLLQRNWGVSFTNWYYEHGPKAANVIEKSTFLKKVVFILIVKPLQIVTKPLIRRANN
jgi:hypothetical protein